MLSISMEMVSSRKEFRRKKNVESIRPGMPIKLIYIDVVLHLDLDSRHSGPRPRMSPLSLHRPANTRSYSEQENISEIHGRILIANIMVEIRTIITTIIQDVKWSVRKEPR